LLRARETFAAFGEIDPHYFGLIVGIATVDEAAGTHVYHSIIEEDTACGLGTHQSPYQSKAAGARQEEQDRDSPLIHTGIFRPDRELRD
jgi:hypothetical protein